MIAAQIDRVIAGQVSVDSLVELAVAGTSHVERFITSVVLRQFLLDDVGFDGDTEMVGLTGQISGNVIVLFLGLEGVVAQITPQYGGHAQFVGQGESLTDLDDLPSAFRRAEVNRRADSGTSHVVRFPDGTPQDLVGLVGIGQQFVVVDLDQEGDFMGVLAGHHAQHAEGRGHRVAAALDRELDDIFWIEVH